MRIKQMKRTKYTPADEGFIFKNYPQMSDAEFAKVFKCNISAFQQKRRKLGLIGRENTGKFKKGHSPTFVNQSPNKTSFKKGDLPYNTKDLGYENERADGYVYIKTEKGMELKQRVVYSEYFGEIPKGYIVVFKDRNTRNFSPKNLEAISKSENLKRNANRQKQTDSIKRSWEYAKKMKEKQVNVLWFKKENK